jgi:hypothetical protein
MKLALTLALMVIVIALTAAPVGLSQVRETANQFISQRSPGNSVTEMVTLTGQRGEADAYILQLSRPGYIIMAADDQLPPVLAYSFRSAYDVEDTRPLIDMLTRDVELRMAWYAQNPASVNTGWTTAGTRPNRTFQQWPADGSTPTDGWICTQWTQSGIYNAMCPNDSSDRRSVVGCVATAMSMLVNFHQYTGDVSFNQSDAYQSGWYNGIMIDGDADARDFPTFNELNGYLDTLTQHYADGTTLTSDDIAALCFACGISVQMGYAYDGSGANTGDVPYALRHKFGFTSASWSDWNNGTIDILTDEAKHMRPTEISILTSEYTNGHAINCDGYNTDNYHHLNFGWGTSDSGCWYSLPEGMPSGYSIITGVAYNIEAGTAPVGVSGTVSTTGSAEGAYVRLTGPWTYEAFITAANGQFTLPAVYPGTYTVSATLGNRFLYDEQTVVIDASHHTLNLSLAEYTAITGSVQGQTTSSAVTVRLYTRPDADLNLLASTTTDGNGNFSFPGQYPGNYVLMANDTAGHWCLADYEYTSAETPALLLLESHDTQLELSRAGSPEDILSMNLPILISMGIRLTSDEMNEHTGKVISGVCFKAPGDAANETITAQVWDGSRLAVEQPVADYSTGDWVQVELPEYVLIQSGHTYYVGYSIISTDHSLSWHDEGPRVANGACFRTTNWTDYAISSNFNFCISAVLRDQTGATLSGTLVPASGNAQLSDAIIRTGLYSATAQADGTFTLSVPAGTYTPTVDLHGYEAASFTETTVADGATANLGSLTLQRDATETNTDSSAPITTRLIGNSPNPFNPETVISFALSDQAPVTLRIYNLRGEVVRTLCNNQVFTAGNHSVTWNGTDDRHQSVSSGVYISEMRSRRFTSVKKMIMLK